MKWVVRDRAVVNRPLEVSPRDQMVRFGRAFFRGIDPTTCTSRVEAQAPELSFSLHLSSLFPFLSLHTKHRGEHHPIRRNGSKSDCFLWCSCYHHHPFRVEFGKLSALRDKHLEGNILTHFVFTLGRAQCTRDGYSCRLETQ